MANTLTPRQNEFFQYLQQCQSTQGTFPSLRLMAVDLGVSHSAVADMLHTLQSKGWIRREGRYSRDITLLKSGPRTLPNGGRLVPIIGQVSAGLPLYAQQESAGEILVDGRVYRGEQLFALRIRGDSMCNAGIYAGDLAICEPRQYAANGEIVVALIGEEATVKRFYYLGDVIELRPENKQFSIMRYELGDVLIQGKVIGIQRGPEEMSRL
nr:transcriptional repressor LexA [uncultured Desulfobulbus sp.]